MNTETDFFRRVEQLNAIGAALSSERDINRLLEKILVAAKKITHADGGTLYSMAEAASGLQFEIVRNNSLGIAFGGTSGNPIPFAALPFLTPDGMPNNSMVAVYCALHQITVNIPDAYEAKGFDFSGTRAFDENTDYHSTSFLMVPMKNHENEIIGVLQLIDAKDLQTGKIIPFSSAAQRLAESLASQAAIALSNRQFTTPQQVVGKATKLQTIFDRIGLVDTRFEVLKLDAKIRMLKAKLALSRTSDAFAEIEMERAFSQQVAQIDEERDFLRNANIGGEAMSEKDQQAVRDIGKKYEWLNTQGERVNFLSDDEVDNLTIRAGTLTEAERGIINNHIVVTLKMLESLPWVKHLKHVPEYAGGHHERMDGKGYPRGLTRDQMSIQARIMASRRSPPGTVLTNRGKH